MSNNKNSPNKESDTTSVIKICIIIFVAIVSFFATTFLFDYFDKNAEYTISTLSSEQLEGESYTERTKYDDSDMWETEVPDDVTLTYNGMTEEYVEIIQSHVSFPLDINTATIDEIMSIDGIGTVTAEKIVDYRNKYGYFYNYTDLMNIDGIGEKKLENLMKYIYISEDMIETTAYSEVTGESSIVTTISVTETETSQTDTVTVYTTEEFIIVNEEFVDDDELESDLDYDEYYNEYETITTQRTVSFPLELNTATIEELTCINGIGNVTAQKIIEYANLYGFYRVEDLLKIEGIGQSKLESIRPYVYVDTYMLPPETETFFQESEWYSETNTTIISVNLNTCGKNELMQLPGIDEELANRIIEVREAIGGFVIIEELTLVDGITDEKMAAILNYIYI